MNELQALQNFADALETGAKITEVFQQDKRRTVKKYVLSINGFSISPALDYEKLNQFMNGFYHAKKRYLI